MPTVVIDRPPPAEIGAVVDSYDSLAFGPSSERWALRVIVGAAAALLVASAMAVVGHTLAPRFFDRGTTGIPVELVAAIATFVTTSAAGGSRRGRSRGGRRCFVTPAWLAELEQELRHDFPDTYES